MELVLIPFLLLSGATLIYLGVHGTQPTPWAMHGPHISTNSGERLPLPLLVERPAPFAFDAHEVEESFEEPRPVQVVEGKRPPETTIVAEVGPAQTFTESDALIGQLMMELTTVRDELVSLRERVDTLSAPAQPDVSIVAAMESAAAETPAPAPKRRRTRAAMTQEAAAV